jgi:hypothetical protein
VGFSVVVCFQIVLHLKDIDILYKIQEYYGGVGNITIHKHRVNFIVNGHSDLINEIIPHFDAFPLITQKQADYLLFRRAVLDYIQHKKHLNLEGVEKLVAIRASINLGLNDTLKKAFASLVPVVRPIVVSKSVPHGM